VIQGKPQTCKDMQPTQAVIRRDTATAEKTPFDLIIVGAGIHGVMLALEAGLRGKRSLLLEKDDFNGATSWNHLRTIHGGLRYLQSLDLPRYFESVAERRWFLANFPALVEALPCLMPLYGRGLKRASIMRAALLLNDVLSLGRNRGVVPSRHLCRGRIVGRRFTREAFPAVERRGLQGSALWFDGAAPEHQRLVMELLRWACALGGTALNYVQAEGLLQHNAQARGVRTRDVLTDTIHEFRAPVVVNAAGPWCRELAQKFDRDHPALFLSRLLLFNILFKRKALSEFALALVPPQRPGHTYFVHNWKGRMLAGTGEALLDENASPLPQPGHIATFLAEMNDAVPELSLQEKDIERVYPGILPTKPGGSQASREVIVNHGDHDGPSGLYSVSGAKYTTARYVADRTLRRIFPRSTRQKSPVPPAEANSRRGCFPFDWDPATAGTAALSGIASLVEEEAVVHLDDLLLRRCGLGENRRRALELLPLLRPLIPWSDLRWQQECERLKGLLREQP
jgi:glycerol-3-phosphate dehydrogenase